MNYQLFHLKDLKSSANLRLNELLSREASAQNLSVWGVFPSLFGLASNEVYWVLLADEAVFPLRADELGIEVLNQATLSPTVRPTTHEPRSEEGIYVFRWFNVGQEHVAEVVELSGQAWETFEGGFDTQVQGLFTVAPTFKAGGHEHTMVLVTWYRDLSVWQNSRAPDEAARSRFVKRQSLMDSALPIATKLVLPN